MTLIIDISRLLSRAEGVLTGVDRVELAYLRQFAVLPDPAFALARTTLGYLLLDKPGMAELARAIQTGVWPKADLLSRWNTRLTEGQKRVRSLARSLAVARCPKWGLAQMLKSCTKGSLHYFNVGHTNLSDRTLLAVKQSGAVISVLVHDVIPLDFPQFQRAGTVVAFAAKIGQVARHADRVICLTHATKAAICARLTERGCCPPTVVAPLGVEVSASRGEPWLELGLKKGRYLIAVGTLEPRKNYDMLLNLWEGTGDHLPPLLICGGWGWESETLRRRLGEGVRGVRHLQGLGDDVIAGLVAGSAGLVFPSLAEGYGLPPLEAAALGTKVVASDLLVLRETLGAAALFLDPNDLMEWGKTLRDWANWPSRNEIFTPPTWDSHFKIVLSMT